MNYETLNKKAQEIFKNGKPVSVYLSENCPGILLPNGDESPIALFLLIHETSDYNFVILVVNDEKYDLSNYKNTIKKIQIVFDMNIDKPKMCLLINDYCHYDNSQKNPIQNKTMIYAENESFQISYLSTNMNFMNYSCSSVNISSYKQNCITKGFIFDYLNKNYLNSTNIDLGDLIYEQEKEKEEEQK